MKKMLYTFWGLMAPVVALAQENASATAAEELSFFWIVIKAIIALLLVIGGIVLVVWVLKQFMNRAQRSNTDGQNGNFTVVQQVNLSPAHTLYAVRFLDDLLVVGGSGDGLSVIHHYPDFTRWDDIKADTSNLTQNFGEVFRNSLTGKFPGKSREKS